MQLILPPISFPAKPIDSRSSKPGDCHPWDSACRPSPMPGDDHPQASSSCDACESDAAALIRAMFGLEDEDAPPSAPPRTMAPAIELDLAPRRIVLITGPSGVGKSTLLRHIARQVESRAPNMSEPRSRAGICGGAGIPGGAGVPPAIGPNGPSARNTPRIITVDHHPPDQSARVIDTFIQPDPPDFDQLTTQLNRVLQTLSRAGLAEPRLWLQPVRTLSDGQRHRLHIARAMHAATGSGPDIFSGAGVPPAIRPQGRSAIDQHTLILADEFANNLDPLTARLISRNVRRWINQSPQTTFIAATTRTDLHASLKPDQTIELEL